MNITETRRQNKQITDNFDFEQFEQNFIRIFTNEEAKPNADCNWFYRLLGEDDNSIETASGYIALCNCSECIKFGRQLPEYISILRALESVQTYTPNAQIELWVSSETFLTDIYECPFAHYEQFYRCPLLQKLSEHLKTLLTKLEVEVFHYSYVNKDSIPRFF